LSEPYPKEADALHLADGRRPVKVLTPSISEKTLFESRVNELR
jgi:hypothetical protein